MIERISNIRWLTLAEALRLSVGNTIDGIESLTVTSVGKRSTGESKFGPWSLQRLTVRDGNTEEKLAVWGFPDLSSFKGALINIESTINRDGKPFGLHIAKDNRDQVELHLKPGIIDLADARESPEQQRHNVEAHDGPKGGDRGHRDDRRDERRGDSRDQRQPDRGGERRPQARQPDNVKRPIHGATVGMAINQANNILLSQHREDGMAYFSSQQYAQDLHNLASDIIRVSEHLEKGNKAPTALQRARAAEPQHEQQRQPQRPTPRQQRDEPPTGEYANEDAGDSPPSFQDGMEVDDIPF